MDERDTNRSVTLQENHTQIDSTHHTAEPPVNGVVGDINGPPSTTTLSTIAIRAGDHATIVVALLKSLGFIELRIAEMKPRLLAIGGSIEETSTLLNIHEDLMARLKDKKDQVSMILTRADNLGAEKKDPKEAVVYCAMSKSLSQAWSELNKQLMLRGYLLKETLSFYRMAYHHEQLTISVSDILRRTLTGDVGLDLHLLLQKMEQVINEIVDTTASAVDLGSSVIAQIRVLGQTNDNVEAAQEILDACVLVETVMLRIASEWESVEQTWLAERAKLVQQTETDELMDIERWLQHAERRIKAVNELGQKILLEEGNARKARLMELGAFGLADGGRVAHLSGRIEEFLHYLKTKMNRSMRIQAFFQSSNSMISQLSMMEADMRNANAAMAGELAPLARQKAATVISEGKDIAAKEVLTHEEHRLVKQRCNEMENKLNNLEKLAEQRKSVGTQQISQEIENLQSWFSSRAFPFLAQHGDIGGNLTDAKEFVANHKEFATEVVNRDVSVISVLSKKSEMSSNEQNLVKKFEENYEKLKDTLENRIQLGNTYEQVHKFAKDLESSFDALTSLLDTNRDFTNERVAAQMNNVFQMIQETLGQEKHQGEKFIANAEQIGRSDELLNIQRAVQSVKNIIMDHDHRFTYVTQKWLEWQQSKAKLKRLEHCVDEVQMWQEEAWEIVRLLNYTNITTVQETEDLQKRVKEFKQTLEQQNRKLEDAMKYTQNEQFTKRVIETSQKQKQIEVLVKELENKVEVVNESFIQEESRERIQAPQLFTSLRDAQVDEGSRFEFAARIEGDPEPVISWLKDGIDVKNNIDYRQDFVNGVASLVIEETFIEDTATYTVRATNAGGTVESSAKLIVKSRSSISSLIEDEKPRFVKQLANVQVNEGQRAHLDCIIVGKPEPEVVWYKEDVTVKEDERIKLEFTGDHCSLTISKTVPSDSGLYSIKAKNIHGETTNFCQLKVTPKKQPPPTPPKPTSRPSSVVVRAPTIQPPLTNTVWQQGDTVTMQVCTQGEPRPRVEWKFNEQPLQTSRDIKIEEQSDGWSLLIINQVSPIHAGMYTVTAENEGGIAKTGATLHIQPSLTSTEIEHMYEEDSYEKIMKPVQQKVETTSRTAMQYSEQHPSVIQKDHEVSSTTSEKRWVDLVEEQISQPSPITTPIPTVLTQTRTAVTEQRWVDEIDEMLSVPRETSEQREVRTAETYVKMVDDLMRDALPQAIREASHSAAQREYVGQYQEAAQPEVRQATVTPSSKMFNVATIRQSPQPEPYTATTTHHASAEHAATIRQSSVPEAHTATTTQFTATESAAQVHTAVPEPDRRSTTMTSTKVGRIDDIIVPVSQKYTTSNVTQTVTDEGYVQRYEEHARPQTTKTTKRTIEGAESMDVQALKRYDGPSKVTVTEKMAEEDFSNKKQFRTHEVPVKRIAQTVKKTTSAEGWVQDIHDDIAKPQIIQTTKEIKKELTEDRRLTSQPPPVTQTTSTITDGYVQHVHEEFPKPHAIQITRRYGEDNENSKEQILKQTIETAPPSSKNVVTTGLVESYRSIADEGHVNEAASTKHRDSYIVASDAEGFWTDGAYTASPTPPPVPKHKLIKEEQYTQMDISDIGLTRSSTEPEFIRAFHKEYTVDEGEQITIECVLVGNPRPKVQFYFNNKLIRMGSEFCKVVNTNDTYSITIDKARLEHAGYYKIVAENKRGYTESLTVLHVRPLSIIRQNSDKKSQILKGRPAEHTKVTEEFSMFEYEQRRPVKHETSRLVTPPPAKRLQQAHRKEEHLEQYDIEERRAAGHPPHFTQTLISAVTSDGNTAKFEGIVTGWPAPAVEWSKDGNVLTRSTLPDVQISNIGGRVSLTFDKCSSQHAGKYMCTARNASGVATSSAQLVVRPKTIAPDFLQRLISEEVVEGNQLKWTVKVTGDPKPKITWLRDGIEIPDCEEVRLINEGNDVHSLVIVRVEAADSGQFTCLAENVAGEARSTADLVVRAEGSQPGSYFHVTKVTQEKQIKGEQPVRNSAFTIENPRQSAML